MKPTASAFKKELKEAIENGGKTTYGKRELLLFIEEVYSYYLERYLED